MLLKHLMKKNLIHYNFISIVALLIAVIYSMAASRYLPEGINSYFLERLLKRLLVPVPFLVLVLGLQIFAIQKGFFYIRKKVERFSISDLVFSLIPLLPVSRYIIANQEMLTAFQSIFLGMIFLATSIIICCLMPLFLSFLVPKFILIVVSTSLLFTVFNMASLPPGTGLLQHPPLSVQMSILGLVFIILLLSRLIPVKPRNYIIVIFFLTVLVMESISFFSYKPPSFQDQDLNSLPIVESVKGKKIRNQNDILLIIYESYANEETLQHYGFDNKAQRKFLEKHGFHIYQGVYSLSSPSIPSMAAVFNVERKIAAHRRNVVGGAALRILKNNGYSTYCVFQSDYFFRGLKFEHILYDEPFPNMFGKSKIGSEAKLIIDAILKGDFSDRTSMERINYADYLEQKYRVIAESEKKPLFMYSHSKYPGHGPAGKGIAIDERKKYLNKYIENIRVANREMRQDVTEITYSKPDSIVIIAGDHGPFLTKTGYGLEYGRGGFDIHDVDRYDVQDRFGAFLAIRWPEKNYAGKYDIQILQDVFPAVFAYLYDDNVLFDKIRTERVTTNQAKALTLGVYVEDGVVVGGKDGGNLLFCCSSSL